MKTRLRCFQSIRPKKANLWEEAAFWRCYQKLKYCIFCSVLVFFHPVSVSVYLWSIWEELLKIQLVMAARRETQHSSKAYSESLFLWWEKWTSNNYHKEYLYHTLHFPSAERLEQEWFCSPFWDLRATKMHPPHPTFPRQGQSGTMSYSNLKSPQLCAAMCP